MEQSKTDAAVGVSQNAPIIRVRGAAARQRSLQEVMKYQNSATGTALEMETAEETSSVMVRDKGHALENAD